MNSNKFSDEFRNNYICNNFNSTDISGLTSSVLLESFDVEIISIRNGDFKVKFYDEYSQLNIVGITYSF